MNINISIRKPVRTFSTISLVTVSLLAVLFITGCDKPCSHSCINGEWSLYYVKIDGVISSQFTSSSHVRLEIDDGDSFSRYVMLTGQYDDLEGSTIRSTGSVEDYCFDDEVNLRFDGQEEWDTYSYQCNSEYLILTQTVDGKVYEYTYAAPGSHD